MAKKNPRPGPSLTQDLSPLNSDCPHCGKLTWADYQSRRTVATLGGLTRLNLTVRRCHNPDCKAHLAGAARAGAADRGGGDAAAGRLHGGGPGRR